MPLQYQRIDIVIILMIFIPYKTNLFPLCNILLSLSGNYDQVIKYIASYLLSDHK